MPSWLLPVRLLVDALLLCTLVFVVSLLVRGPLSVAPLETIHGVDYVGSDTSTVIAESFAHTDVSIPASVLGKQATITVDYIPHEIRQLDIGIRENSFWLSYPWITIYRVGDATDPTRTRSTTVRIPLTDKLQDTDGTLDLMFRANGEPVPPAALLDTAQWELVDLEAALEHRVPTRTEIVQFARRIISRERPL